MRKLAYMAARVMLNRVFSTLFILTSLTLLATGYATYGPQGNLAAQYIPEQMKVVFTYVDPIWYLSNMKAIFYISIAIGAIGVLVAFAAPYLPRGEKQMKVQAHFERKHVIRALFPTVVIVTYPMLLAQGLAGSGIEGAATFKAEAAFLFKTADLIVTYGFFAGYMQLAHDIMPLLLKPAYERSIALSESGSLEADLKAAGIDTEGLGNKLKGMSPKQLAKLKIAAQQGAATRKLKEEQAAEQAALLRQTSEEDQANQAALQKLLGQSAASEEASSGVQTPKKPVLIELEEGEAEEVSPSDAPQQA